MQSSNVISVNKQTWLFYEKMLKDVNKDEETWDGKLVVEGAGYDRVTIVLMYNTNNPFSESEE